ncbi:Apolipoprotein N-acyltransferase [Ralstonia mannitolilytica]|nr:Apolipoprotein N-acyltransferase [Ralstonia mannitolilytica]
MVRARSAESMVASRSSLQAEQLALRALAYLLAAVCGGALACAFAPWSVRWAGVGGMVGLGLLFSAAVSPRQAGRILFAAGIGLLVVGTTWVIRAIEGGAASAPWMVPVIFAAFVIIGALPYAVMGWVGARLVPLHGGELRPRVLRAALILPAAWTLGEGLRSSGPLAVPWMLTAVAQVPDGLVAGWLPVLGVYGTGWLVWTMAGGCTCAWILVRRGRMRSAVLAAVLPLAMLGASVPMARIGWTRPEPFPLSVRLWQTNHPQGEKWSRDVADATAEALLDRVRRMPANGILVTPELLMIDPWQMLPATWTESLQARLAERDGTLLLGIPAADTATRRLFNTITVVGPHVRESAGPQMYAKGRLALFGERLPAKALLGSLYTRAFHWPLQDLSVPEPSENTALLYAAGHVLAAAICFETGFTRDGAQRDPRAAFIVNPSNDAWFESPRYNAHALQVSQAAAMETGKPVLRANNVGYTAIIRPSGSLQALLPSGVDGELTADVVGHTGATPFARIGEPLIIGICCGGFFLAWHLRRRRMDPLST